MRCDWILPGPQETGRKKAIPASFLGKKEIKSKPRRKKGRAHTGRKCQPAGNSRHGRLPKLRISNRAEKSIDKRARNRREVTEKNVEKESQSQHKENSDNLQTIDWNKDIGFHAREEFQLRKVRNRFRGRERREKRREAATCGAKQRQPETSHPGRKMMNQWSISAFPT